MQRVIGTIGIMAMLCAVAMHAVAQGGPQPLAGTVASLTADTLTIKLTTGDTAQVRLASNARLTGRAAADWSKVTDGTFLGVTSVANADGTRHATEVHIFPESMRGSGEGHRPMATPGNTMTNATVGKVEGGSRPRSTMTNATVAAVGAAGARRMTLRYPGGEQIITVPENTPIVMVEPGDRSLLVPGAHVIVYATRAADGGWTSDRVSAGRNGVVPPI